MNTSKVPSSELNRLVTEHGVNQNLDDMYGVMTDIQNCYWKYIDEHDISDLYFKQFALEMFRYLPYLRQFTRLSIFMKLHRQFKQKKKQQPVSGAILVSTGKTHVLLVQSCSSKRWSFPSGKMEATDKDSFESCACREVYEETSFRIDDLLQPSDYIDVASKTEATTRLYMIYNVSMSETFKPCLKGEIKQCQWFEIAKLHDTISENRIQFSIVDSILKKSDFSALLPALPQLPTLPRHHDATPKEITVDG